MPRGDTDGGGQLNQLPLGVTGGLEKVSGHRLGSQKIGILGVGLWVLILPGVVFSVLPHTPTWAELVICPRQPQLSPLGLVLRVNLCCAGPWEPPCGPAMDARVRGV